MDERTDPREVDSGGIAGPGGPHDWGQVVLDAKNAILVDDVGVSIVDPIRDGERENDPIIALVLGGRINKTLERARVMFLFNEDGAAGIVTELIAMSYRAGFGDEFKTRVGLRWNELMEQGNAEERHENT